MSETFHVVEVTLSAGDVMLNASRTINTQPELALAQQAVYEELVTKHSNKGELVHEILKILPPEEPGIGVIKDVDSNYSVISSKPLSVEQIKKVLIKDLPTVIPAED
jgi:hypothetical protein